MSGATLAIGDRVTVETGAGLVHTVRGFDDEGRVLVRAVGDDRTYSADPDEVRPYDAECCGCGQIGCAWI